MVPSYHRPGMQRLGARCEIGRVVCWGRTPLTWRVVPSLARNSGAPLRVSVWRGSLDIRGWLCRWIPKQPYPSCRRGRSRHISTLASCFSFAVSSSEIGLLP
ncbi:hypothetical protein LINGRAHAP2_LOCUS35663 [Linum grandiflorum]